jgi:predicted DNA-binding transcriptional regulator AlpA
VLIARASTATNAGPAVTDERLITVDEAVTQFGVSRQWLYRHKHQLPHSQPSRKVLLFPEQKLNKWFAAHKAS